MYNNWKNEIKEKEEEFETREKDLNERIQQLTKINEETMNEKWDINWKLNYTVII